MWECVRICPHCLCLFFHLWRTLLISGGEQNKAQSMSLQTQVHTLPQRLIWRTFFFIIFSRSNVLLAESRFIFQLEMKVPDLYMPSLNHKSSLTVDLLLVGDCSLSHDSDKVLAPGSCLRVLCNWCYSGKGLNSPWGRSSFFVVMLMDLPHTIWDNIVHPAVFITVTWFWCICVSICKFVRFAIIFSVNKVLTQWPGVDLDSLISAGCAEHS